MYVLTLGILCSDCPTGCVGSAMHLSVATTLVTCSFQSVPTSHLNEMSMCVQLWATNPAQSGDEPHFCLLLAWRSGASADAMNVANS